MQEQTHYIVRIKERGSDHEIETHFVGNKTRRYIIDFYGLEKDDVESYTIQIAGRPELYGHRKARQA